MVLRIGPAFICVHMDNDHRICSTSPMKRKVYAMRVTGRRGDGSTFHHTASLRTEVVSATLTRFIGTVYAVDPCAYTGVELWCDGDVLNAQTFPRPTHVSVGMELNVHVDLTHLPGQVDHPWQFDEITPPKFATVEEAQEWLDARA